ncbi:hypothetical protein LLH23_07090 [bacterium]|nr:hypothetical protein [bacterium]
MRCTVCLVAVLLATCVFAQASFEDDFSSYPPDSDGAPTWETEGLGWTVMPGGKFTAEMKGRSVALCTKAARGRLQVIEATLTVTASVGDNWKVAGLVIQDDERNYWHLALVESPDAQGAKHYIELQESYEGQWLASGATKTKLTTVESRSFEWEKNHPYRLRLEMAADTISGAFSELDGTLRGRIVLKLDNPLVVNTGTAALDCGGFRAEFSRFTVNVTQTAPPRPKPVVTYAPCDVKGMAAVRDTATGFFHLKQQDGRWWLITPRGEGFYALGTDHANYNAHWCEKLGYAPYHKSCVAKYNDDEEAWARSTRDRLQAWNFNALGCGWSKGMKGKGLPRCEFASFGSGFAGVDDIAPKVHWTGFPNVFSPKWPIYCDKRAKSYCGSFKDDPWVIGTFLDNELEWYGKNGKPWGLFDETMKKPAGHTAKAAALAFLQARYPTIAALNAAWKTQLPSWQAVSESTALDSSTEQADRDRLDFIRLIADKYFTVTNAAMKKYDPHHLNLGCRFAGRMPPGVIEVCGQVCDIVTVNYYGHVDLDRGLSTDMPKIFADYAARGQRPMMITEWSFPAYDSGLPCQHGAGQRVATQAEKARCYEIYQTALMSFPFMVGSNYFMWVDEPALGISSTFPEDSNYGLVDVDDRPWPELTQTATRVNARVYEIHSGKTPEVAVAIADDGRSLTLKNTGGAKADFALHVWVDGKATVTRQSLAAGAKAKVTVPKPTDAGAGHLIAAVADPEGTLAETDRSDNLATRLVSAAAANGRYAPGQRPLPIVVSNPSSQPLPQARVNQMLPGLTAGPITTASGAAVVSQVDVEGKQAELTFEAGALPPYGCRTFILHPGKASPPAGTAVQTQVTEGGLEATNGLLTIKHEAGSSDLLSSIAAGDLLLGRLGALVHQQLSQPLWVAPDKTEQITCHNGPVRFTADLIVAATGGGADTKTAAGQDGTYAPQRARPHHYRACYRLALYPGQPCFTSRLLWIENTDTEPWLMASYFHYAHSNIGGDQANDIAATKLPSGVVAWTNTKLDGALGCLTITPGDFRMNFWRDPGEKGGQHPDVWRELNTSLKPGERYDAPQPAATFFGAKSLVGVPDIAAAARATGRAQCQVVGMGTR